MFEKLRSLFASSPKTLPQAAETLKEATANLDSVEAALKAEIENRDTKIAGLTAELAEAEKEGEAATKELEQIKATLALRDSTLSAFAEQFAVIGLADLTNKTPAAEVKSKFDAHVAKQTTLALAKTGHPPAHVPAVETAPASKTDADIAKEYQAMRPGPERLAFYTQHEAALERFAKSLRRQD